MTNGNTLKKFNTEKLPNFLIEKLQNQYGEKVAEIINGYKAKRKTTFRINTIKSNNEEIETVLKKENIKFAKPSFSNIAYIIENANEADLQELEIYKEGKIYLQSLSSMLPPIILNPTENKDILDMAAAPGGKTTQMAALTHNKAHITACEMNSVRAERLKYNVEKQGASCVYCMIKDSRNIDDFFSFDQILLDAPCSGSGTLNINENIQKYFTQKLIEKSVKAQTALLNKAVNILKPGCEMVYSTCSILACENEDVVNSVLKKGKVEIVPIEDDFVKDLPLLPTKLPGTLCIAPNELYEGFFVAKLRKI
ncbi:MAG: RsmB/NOP family class I SAM-dependent RNA methyltransferase [Clostridia bacterium]|nr:RsmB/NOP family class I SAM-dependent RNA methyltransferase [Clostridia bacterium]